MAGPLLFVASLVLATFIAIAFSNMNKRLERKHNWIDKVAIWILPLVMLLSPWFAEYPINLKNSKCLSKAVSFDPEGNVDDASSTFVWCVTNYCTTAPWKRDVDVDEPAAVGGVPVIITIKGTAEVTDYNRFFTAPGVYKPSSWWDTNGETANSEALSKAVSEELYQLIARHASELEATASLPRRLGGPSIDDFIDKYISPNLDRFGIKYTVTDFEIKWPRGYVPPSLGPRSY